MLEVSQLCKNLGHINGTIALWKTAQVLNIPGLMKTKTELLKQEAGATIHAKPLEETQKKNATILTELTIVGKLALTVKTTRIAFIHTKLNGTQKSNVTAIVLPTVESQTSIIITCASGTTSDNSTIEPDWPPSVFGQIFIQSNLVKL